jgi:hypothetical protein
MISRHLDPRSVMKLIGRTSRAIWSFFIIVVSY